MERKTGCAVWLVIAMAVVALLVAWQYWDYCQATRTLPDHMTIGGLPVGSMTRAEALNALEVAFATPLNVSYAHHTLSLSPDAVALRYDADRTAANLEQAAAEHHGLDGFLRHVLRGQPSPVSVPVVVTYSEQRLARFLDRVADQYDQPAHEPQALLPTLDVASGQPGYRLDVEASRSRLASALVSASTHDVELEVVVERVSPRDMSLLRRLLESRFDQESRLMPAVFVKNLGSGGELGLNAEREHAGLNLLKVAVMVEAYRMLDQPPSAESMELISQAMYQGDEATLGLLLRELVGEGDEHRGARELTASMNRLGLLRTVIEPSAPSGGPHNQSATPTGWSTDSSTNPALAARTTPLDMGLLLEMVYHCGQGGGTLMMTYPNAVTAGECQEMMNHMDQERGDALIVAGLPADASVAHQAGRTSDTQMEAAIVSTTGGDFVLVVFLRAPRGLAGEEYASLFSDVATAAYNYFNPSP